MMREEIIAVCVVVFLLVGSFTGAYFFEKHKCVSKSGMMAVNHRFSLMHGCMIEYESGKWIDIEKYRVVD